MNKPPILSQEQRAKLKHDAEIVTAQNPGGRFQFVEGCLSLIAELEIKEAVIDQLGQHKLIDSRCGAMMPMESGMYRCILEARDGHTEHQFNYFRAMTKQEKDKWYPEEQQG